MHRHRVAPAVGTDLADLMAAGRLRVQAGKVVGVSEADGVAEIRIAPRAGGPVVLLRADAVVNCTGPADAIDDGSRPLIASLLAQGLAEPGPHGLGLAVTDAGEVIGSNGACYALDWLRRGVLWETIAIAEIRDQAEALAAATHTPPTVLID